MEERDRLAERFEVERARLRAVAYRILESLSDADDAVQEAWLRLNRSDITEIDNLGGWLTTVVARICLDVLRARSARREDPADTSASEPDEGADPEEAALLADSVGRALLVVLEALGPAERLAFVLHDVFAVPFTDIASVLGVSPTAARQLACRARRRVQHAPPPAVDHHQQQEAVTAFLAASRNGEFDALLSLLHPAVVLRADEAAVRGGASRLLVGPEAVAGTFSGRARAARPALVDGVPGAVWFVGGPLRMAFAFTVVDGRVAATSCVPILTN